MDIDAYFQRVGFTGTPGATLEVLGELHLLHPQAIAFENLSSLLGLNVSLQPEQVFDKLIRGGRGGYCFEHNLIFSTILKEIGFDVSEHAARVVWRSPDKTQMARTHMLLKVSIDGSDYIADVGFGGLTMTAPLLLEPDLAQQSPHEDFMITQDGDEYIISAMIKGNWKAMVVFDLVPQYPVDFEQANYFVSTHPQSLFTQNLILARPGNEGRQAMDNRVYIKYNREGAREEELIEDSDHFIALLQDNFNINPADSLDIEKLKSRFDALS